MKLTLLAALCATALAMCSCKTIDRAGDAVLNTFRGNPKTAEEIADTSLPAASVNHNTAVMTLNVLGAKRRVVIQLDPQLAPKTVANFKKLVNAGYYNGLAFHRALHGFLVQTGDPATRSDGDRSAWGLTDIGYKLGPEVSGKHVKGALSMSRTNTAIDSGDRQCSGSQFFVMLRSDTKLDGNYNVFGKVTQGLEVLEAIAGMTVDTNDCPAKRMEITSLRLVPVDSPELLTGGTQGRIKPEGEKGKGGRFFGRLW